MLMLNKCIKSFKENKKAYIKAWIVGALSGIAVWFIFNIITYDNPMMQHVPQGIIIFVSSWIGITIVIAKTMETHNRLLVKEIMENKTILKAVISCDLKDRIIEYMNINDMSYCEAVSILIEKGLNANNDYELVQSYVNIAKTAKKGLKSDDAT